MSRHTSLCMERVIIPVAKEERLVWRHARRKITFMEVLRMAVTCGAESQLS